MTIPCPSCATPDQEVGKFCENCGYFIASADPIPQPAVNPAQGTPAAASPTPQALGTDPAPVIPPVTGIVPPPQTGASAPSGSAQFAVVILGKADPAQGFTITKTGEYLVGRSDAESGNQADIDVRQWVQPMIIQGQKQYLIHRRQCYLALTAEGDVTIRSSPGSELDTLVKAAGSASFVPLQTFGTVRNARPDSSYELEPGDQIFMGDPDALPYYQNNAPTAAGSYLVLELMPRAKD